MPQWATTLDSVARSEQGKPGEEELSGQDLNALINSINGEIEAADRDHQSRRAAETFAEAWQVLRFELAGRLFVVPTSQLIELAPVPEITAVPGLPPLVRGLAHVRGRILAVIDLSAGETLTRRMVVVRGEDDWLAGVLVDASHGITEISIERVHQGVTSSDSLFDAIALEAFVLGTVPLDGQEASVVDLAALAREHIAPAAQGTDA